LIYILIEFSHWEIWLKTEMQSQPCSSHCSCAVEIYDYILIIKSCSVPTPKAINLLFLRNIIIRWKHLITGVVVLRRVWRYQSGNQNPYIEEEQTTQWPKDKGQKDKQYTNPTKNGGELRCSGGVSSSYSSSDTLKKIDCIVWLNHISASCLLILLLCHNSK
jgi:hypothetical protein